MAEDRSEWREEVQRVLDTYGSDRARWPASVRQRLEWLIDSDAACRRHLAEARALERVLDTAPTARPDRMTALADRIAARAAMVPDAPVALASYQANPAGDNVVALRPVRPGRRDLPVSQSAVRAGALIAASLMAGVYFGAATNVLPLVEDMAESVGIVADIDGTGVLGFADFGDEETL